MANAVCSYEETRSLRNIAFRNIYNEYKKTDEYKLVNKLIEDDVLNSSILDLLSIDDSLLTDRAIRVKRAAENLTLTLLDV